MPKLIDGNEVASTHAYGDALYPPVILMPFALSPTLHVFKYSVSATLVLYILCNDDSADSGVYVRAPQFNNERAPHS